MVCGAAVLWIASLFLTGETELKALRQVGKMHWMLSVSAASGAQKTGPRTKNLEGSSGWKRGMRRPAAPVVPMAAPRNPLSDPPVLHRRSSESFFRAARRSFSSTSRFTALYVLRHNTT
jgi:hypothetical protein